MPGQTKRKFDYLLSSDSSEFIVFPSFQPIIVTPNMYGGEFLMVAPGYHGKSRTFREEHHGICALKGGLILFKI